MELVNIECRCKDCEHSEQYDRSIEALHCYFWDYEQGMSPNTVYHNDFCSYGEKRK